MYKTHTFTEEQLKAINAPMDKPLIINGVSGSGKTTIAFERVLHLMKKENLKANNFLFLTSNDFILNYIKNEFNNNDDIIKYSFNGLFYEIVGKRVKLIEEKDKIISMYDTKTFSNQKEYLETQIKESKLKSSLKYKKMIDNYLEEYANKLIPKRDFIFANVRIIKSSTVREMFFEKYKNLPFERRLDEIKEYIFQKIQKNSYEIIKQIIENRSVAIQQLMKKDLSLQEIKFRKGRIFKETENLLKKLYKLDRDIVSIYIKKSIFNNARSIYKDFVSTLYNEPKTYLHQSIYKFDDLPPIIYIHNKVYGITFKEEIKHIIIDNIQDYGEFQFFILQDILKSNSFTLLGDISQSIYFHRSIRSWNDFVNTHFPEEEITFIELNTSYTISKDITSLTNKALSNIPENDKDMIKYIKSENNIENILTVFSAIDFDKIGRDIARKIREIKKGNKYRSIAIIARNTKECRSIKKTVGNYITEPPLIQDSTLICEDIVCVIPAHLAKGIKFDYVFFINVSEDIFDKKNILDIKLFCIAITSAIQKLDIYFIENISNLMIE